MTFASCCMFMICDSLHVTIDMIYAGSHTQSLLNERATHAQRSARSANGPPKKMSIMCPTRNMDIHPRSFNSSPLKMDGWNIDFPFGMITFQGRSVKLQGGIFQFIYINVSTHIPVAALAIGVLETSSSRVGFLFIETT